jgi:chemotaxis protein MotB
MPPNRSKKPTGWRLAAGLTIFGICFLVLSIVIYTETASERSRLGPLTEDNRLLREELSTVEGLLDQIKETLQEQSGKLESSTSELEKSRLARLELEREKMKRLLRIEERAKQVKRVRSRIAELPELEESSIFIQGDGLVIRLPNEVLFAPAEAAIQEQGAELLTKIIGVLISEFEGLSLRVEGHTDNVPIGEAIQEQFPSNWHLSAARAAAAAVLIEEVGWPDPDSIEVIGRGQSQPIASNETEEGKARNRRIDLVITMSNTMPDDA